MIITNRKIISMIVFIQFFLIISVYLIIEVQPQIDILIRIIFAVLGMIGLVFINIKEKSFFLLFFTIVSYLFYIVDLFFPMCQSLYKRIDLTFENSFLSYTEGFILFTCFGYFVLRLFKKETL